MERTFERLQTLRKALDSWWFKFFAIFWTLLGCWDLFVGQFLSPELAIEMPRFYDIINATTGQLPLMGWVLIGAIALVLATIEYAYRLQRENSKENASAVKDEATSEVRHYESERTYIVYGGKLTIAHGLGYAPHDIQIFLVCNDSELGYSQDDQVFLSPEDLPMEVTSDKENIYVVGPNTSKLKIRRKDAYAYQSREKYEIMQNKWRMKIVAR